MYACRTDGGWISTDPLTHPPTITPIVDKGSQHQNENTGQQKQERQTTAKAQHKGTDRHEDTNIISFSVRTSGRVASSGTMPQAGRSRVRFLTRSWFFNWPNSSSRTMALGSTQPLTEMSSRNFLGGQGRPGGVYSWKPHRHLWGDVHKMWEPRRPTTLWASTACYRNTFNFLYTYTSNIF
jgi:hypothetical protein